MYPCPGAINNCYVLEIINTKTGKKSSEEGIELEAFAPDLVTAFDLFTKEKKYQGTNWAWCKPVVKDVKLEQSPWSEDSRIVNRCVGASIWYANRVVGMSLRLR